MMRWSENETYEFVKLYLSHDYLWNSNHENYKSKDKRREAFQAIISEFMSCTGIILNESELKMKIRNLRSTYAQEITKIRARSRPNSPYTPTIKWFSDWHKCCKHKSRKSHVNLEYEEQAHTDEVNQKTWISDETEDVTIETSVDLFSTDNNEICDTNHIKSNNIDRHSLYKLNRKKVEPRSPSTAQSDRTFRESLDSNFESISKEDEFDIYGRYIASQLRKMDLQKALRLQLEIQSLVSEARIEDLTSPH